MLHHPKIEYAKTLKPNGQIHTAMTRVIDPAKTLHLSIAIEVQADFVRLLASRKRRKTFPADIEDFAAELREPQIATT